MSLISAVALSGCGVSGSNEAVVAMSTTTELGTIQGSNYGGHAPVTGSRIFVLEATTNGYGAIAKSLLSSSYSGSYATAQDSTRDATSGMYYVTTDSTGSFNITGDYTCDAGRPVYLYASGGNPSTNPAVTLTKFSITSNVVTFTASNLLYQGESITIASVPSTYSYLNGTYVVSSTGLTTSTFEVALNHANVGATTLSSGTATQTNAPNNPAIVNMAMLGICPSSGNFSGGGTVSLANGSAPQAFNGLSYVYMNEVSTVAMSYAMAGFAVDSLHIGSSATNLMGLQNAALNANTLYNIQGNGPSTTTQDGEGHIANAVNPNNGNGTVPQQTINTLANIVANCVDSANTSVGTTSAALLAESGGCSGLFIHATSDGLTASTATGGADVPIDTATAMINLAHYPAGVNSYPGYPTNAYVDSGNPTALFNLPAGNVPFLPQLAVAPKDWTIALTYKSVPTPSAIAIDASGDAYVGTYSATAGYITELGAQGSLLATSATSVPNLYGLAVSVGNPGANTVWATSNSSNKVYQLSSSLGTSSAFTSNYTNNPSALAIDKSGNVYVANTSGNYQYYYLSEFNSAGTEVAYNGNYNYSQANGMALTTGGSVWVSSSNNSFGLYPNPSAQSGAVTPTPVGGFSNNNAIAVDYLGDVWVTGKQTGNQALVECTASSSNCSVPTSYGINQYDNFAIGGLNNPVALAVDGSNVNNSGYFNVWVANSGNSTVSEITSSSQYNTLSPSVGYQSNTNLVNSPSAIAVDNSGNVWVTNQGNSTVMEIIGSATPVTTPLAAQKPGVAP